MARQIDFRPYQRQFLNPLKTAAGVWSLREGFLVRVEEDGHAGYGEVAPLPSFGTETLEEARHFLEFLVENPNAEVPSDRPCCAFGVSAARATGCFSGSLEIAALLPNGAEVLDLAREKVAAGYRTLKWKIGVEPADAETALCGELLEVIGADSKLRLDANRGLDSEGLRNWLEFLSPHSSQIEFIEQPLPVGEEAAMAKIAADYAIPIALDESLNGSGGDVWFEEGAWGGPLVIKPLLMGDFDRLVERLRPHAERLVFSSVFETGVGLGNAAALMGALPKSHYAAGFDTLAAFDDSFSIKTQSAEICAAEISGFNCEELWNRLPHSK